MFTKKQVLKLGSDFVYKLFTYSAAKLDIDCGKEDLVSGHCFLYANAFSKILQGSKVASFSTDHYFIEYNGNYYDGLGSIRHTMNTIRLWDYEQDTYPYVYAPQEFYKSQIYYQGTNAKNDLYAEHTMQLPHKKAIWGVYYIGFDSIKDEFLEELYKKDKLTDEELEEIINKYLKKAKGIIDSENYFRKEDNGFEIGKVFDIFMKYRGLITGKQVVEYYEKPVPELVEEEDNKYNEKEDNISKYFTTEPPTMIQNILKYKLKNKKGEDK